MDYNLVLKARAENELSDAISWYESQQRGLGLAFLNTIETYLNGIQQNPYLYPSRKIPYREAVVRKFPYIIIYEVVDNEVVVYSIFHTHRNPKNKT